MAYCNAKVEVRFPSNLHSFPFYFFAAEEVSKRFKNMKETFASNHRKVRESQKKCSGKGAAETFSPSWFLYKYLQHLVKTCAQADSESNLSAPVDSEDSNSLSPLTHYYDVTMQVRLQ